MSFASALRDVELGTLQAMRRILVSRRNDSGHGHDQRDQLVAIDAEIERRHRSIRRIDGIIERLQQPASRQIFRRLFEDRQQSPECADGRIPSDSPERLRDAEFARVVRGAQS